MSKHAETVKSPQASSTQRKARFILLNTIRLVLILAMLFALFEGRNLILLTASIVFILTFVPTIFASLFKKESVALYDIVIILFIFGLFSFWEIKGVYANYWMLAFFMNFAQAIALGMLGLTLVYTFFKYAKLETSSFAFFFLSFSLGFTLGAILEISKFVLDSLFNFRVHEAGLFGTVGNLIVYLTGSFIISLAGFFSIKNGKPILVSKFLENVIEKSPKLFGVKNPPASEDHSQKIIELIKKGEGNKLEFKSTLRKNLHTNNMDRQIEHSVLKTINAYLNSDGGTLLIGVSDKGEITGLEHDQFLTDDHAYRHLTQLINEHIGAEFLPLIQTNIIKLNGKTLLKVDCKKSDKEAFLKTGKDEHFYVRQGSLSMPLTGSELLRYVETAFRNKS